MKRTFALGFAVAFLLTAAGSAHAWHIVSHDVDIVIGADGRLDVLEKLRVDFGTEKWHGIHRKIPLGSGAKRLTIELGSVTDEKGAARKTQVTKDQKQVRIRIGDPDVLVSGVQHYHIRYHATGAMSPVGDRHRLHWNAIGNAWDGCDSIGPSVISVKVPAGVKPADATARIHLGNGEVLDEYTIARENATGIIRFHVSRSLRPGEGATIAIVLPKGAVRLPASRPASRPAGAPSRPATRDALKEESAR